MGNRGPSKTPTAILEKRGSWRAKVRNGEPVANVGCEPPSWLNGEALRAWHELEPRLRNMGVVSDIDWRILARYCTYWVLWLKELSKDGRFETDMERYANQLTKMERELGLTPSARASLSVNEPNKQKDKFFRIA